MELIFAGRNFCVENRKAKRFEKIEITKDTILIEGISDIQIKDVYACLQNEELRNITFIVQNEQPFNISLIMEDVITFQKILKSLQEVCCSMEISQQNKKINGYAAAILEKLREGIKTGIVDTKEQNNIKCCPICGMECDPNIPYCMECGAEV